VDAGRRQRAIGAPGQDLAEYHAEIVDVFEPPPLLQAVQLALGVRCVGDAARDVEARRALLDKLGRLRNLPACRFSSTSSKWV
jgi:hypothetical protein